ncbi:hypothetical protein [Calothrix sp. NIES-2098]|uniref:hypothetical protein n=1 Tax=Calothrix sp. NIES-2098 TaxID=1954171 RepID=UPI000B5F2F11|nr:hypothetical protein NIES2098_00320 [Calothrix sp. NIES-2098]
MQIIQPLIVTKFQPLGFGVRKPLGYSHRLLSRKESSSLYGHHTIKPLGDRVPLVTYSQFLQSHDNQVFSDPSIDANFPETENINTDLTLIQFDTVDSVFSDSNNLDSEYIEGDIPNILPTANTSDTNNITLESNIKVKSKSKRTEKLSDSEAKSKAKSRAKKTTKSSKQIDDIPIVNNNDGLVTLNQNQALDANKETKIQSNINDKITDGGTSINTWKASLIVNNESGLSENFANEETPAIADSVSTVDRADLPTISPATNSSEIRTRSPQETASKTIANDTAKSSESESNVTSIVDTLTLLSNLNPREQTILTEDSQVVDVSDIPINQTAKQQEIVTNSNILNQQDLFSTQQQEHLPATIRNSQEITNNLPDSSNYLLDTTKPRVEDTANLSRNLVNLSEAPSPLPNTEDLTTVNALDAENIPNITTPEIVSNISVQPAPISPVIEDNLIVTPELQSTEVVNFANAPANVTPLQTDSTSNIQLASTSPVIAQAIVTSESQSLESDNLGNAPENVTSLQTDSTSNIPVQLVPTPPVIADRGIILDASESITPQQTDNASDVPVELAATPPFIADNPIIASESVNLSDIRENMTHRQTDSTSNVPVQLTPTSPVIADNPMVSSKSQSAESVNLLDVQESLVLSPDDSQKNTEIPTVVTPLQLRQSTEVDTVAVDESAMSDEKPHSVYASATSSIILEAGNDEQPVKPDLPSTVTSLTFTENQSETLDNLPAPQGFATGGQVTHSSVENPQIASSDTVPAMLTPGEFVVNANDAQKNLHILRHINTGGTAEDMILPSLELPTPETPTKVDSFADTSLQRQKSDNSESEESNSLTPASLSTEISQHRLSSHSSLPLNTVENNTTARTEPSPHYSLPTLIFRKTTSNTNAPYETPTQWSSVEELLNGNNDPFTSFNFNEEESNWQNSEHSQTSQPSPQVFTKRLTSAQGFANGGEVTAPDIATDIQPITETIQSPSAANPEADESRNLEALAYEIYNRLRQRIEVERERQGIYLGRLPW